MAITYTPATNFGAKDTLPTNDPAKVIKGAEFTTEFNAIQTAFGFAAPTSSPTFTGTVTIPALNFGGTVVTASAAELNILDGVTATTAELNILDGVTATAAEINVFDGITVTTSELNHLNGVTSSVQTQLDAKAPLVSPSFTGAVSFDSGTIKLNSNLDANNNVALGDTTLNLLTTGTRNTAIGSSALTSNTSGSRNNALGYEALYSNTTGGFNIAVGDQALRANTTGSGNVAVGQNALYNNISGSFNTANGYWSLYNNSTGDNNVSVGYASFYSNTIGQNNTALGSLSFYSSVTGDNNVSVGTAALYSANGTIRNVAIGAESGYGITTGSNNTLIGYNSDLLNPAGLGQIVIGSGVSGTANNRITVGSGANIAELDLDGVDTSWAASSDKRLKKDITDYTAGLSFISELRPVTYKWRAKCDVPEELSLHDNSNDPVHGKLNVTYHGFVAQEIKQALDNHPEVADGQHFWKLRDDGIQTVAPADLVPILVNAIKELASRLEAAEAEIKILHGV